MIINKNQPIGVVKKSLIVACLNNKPSLFLPYLMSRNVKTDFPNKLKFYNHFKKILKREHKHLKGKLYLKLEKPSYNKNSNDTYLNFYDRVHKYSRISIKFMEESNSISFDILPF